MDGAPAQMVPSALAEPRVPASVGCGKSAGESSAPGGLRPRGVSRAASFRRSVKRFRRQVSAPRRPPERLQRRQQLQQPLAIGRRASVRRSCCAPFSQRSLSPEFLQPLSALQGQTPQGEQQTSPLSPRLGTCALPSCWSFVWASSRPKKLFMAPALRGRQPSLYGCFSRNRSVDFLRFRFVHAEDVDEI